MRVRGAIQLLAFVCVCVSACFAHHAALIVNKENGVEDLRSVELVKIIHGEVAKWPDGKNVTLVLHRDWEGENETLAHLNKMTAAQWKSFLAAHKRSVAFVEGDKDVLKAVQADPGAIGLIEVHSIDNSVKVVRVDGKLPMEFGYLPH
ncbi:MAG: hypothetical protein ACRD3B_17745 [Candidatus Sulfotelmatobacter sp.]